MRLEYSAAMCCGGGRIYLFLPFLPFFSPLLLVEFSTTDEMFQEYSNLHNEVEKPGLTLQPLCSQLTSPGGRLFVQAHWVVSWKLFRSSFLAVGYYPTRKQLWKHTFLECVFAG